MASLVIRLLHGFSLEFPSIRMAGKTSTIVGLLLALAILVAVSEGTRKKGKFSTPGGSHCRWVEKKKHNGTDVSYSLRCKCHSKAGGMMKYRCTYHTSFHGAEGKSSQFTETFFENIKGKIQLAVHILLHAHLSFVS